MGEGARCRRDGAGTDSTSSRRRWEEGKGRQRAQPDRDRSTARVRRTWPVNFFCYARQPAVPSSSSSPQAARYAMGRRRKTRTHVKPPDGPDGDGNPKSFIIKHGQVGTSLAQLVRDLRKVMEPNTASRLKVCSDHCQGDALSHYSIVGKDKK